MRRFVVLLALFSVVAWSSRVVPRLSERKLALAAADANALLRWGATMGGSQTVTASQAVADAQNVDTLVGLPGTFAKYTASMRAANPSLKLVFYMNGVYATGAAQDTYPESWYLHDATGNRITSTQFGNPLMDPTNPSWIQSRVADCASALAATGWDGCYLDMLGAGTLTPNYLSSTPLDPATGSPWTNVEWIDATTNLAATVVAALPGTYLIGNGLGNGTQYFSSNWGPSALLVGPLAGGDAQGFVRGDTDPATTFRPEVQWKADVDMLVDAGLRGKSVLVEAKVWANGATQDQKSAIHRYALATFLLGTNGNQYWYWSDTGSESAVVEDTPYDHVDIGTPIGGYAKMLGAYQRRYSGGLVVVNPTSAAVTIPLAAGSWTSLTGTVVQDHITLGADTGDVLTTTTPWGPVPSVSTSQVSQITPTSATVSSLVDPEGLATTTNAEYGTGSTLGSISHPVAAGDGIAQTTVAITIAGLQPGTTYTVHVDASNSAGTIAGGDLTFTTLLPAPTVRTAGAVVAGTQATVNGFVNPNGLATNYDVEYGATTNYGKTSALLPAGSAAGLVPESVTLGALGAGTIHYRFVATNSTGTTAGADRTVRIK